MSKKRKSQAKSMVMIPLYRLRVVDDKTKYSRKEKHRSYRTDGSNSSLLPILVSC